MLENELWGNTIENWGISILIILGTIIIVKLLSLLGKKVYKPFVTGTDQSPGRRHFLLFGSAC